MISKVFRNVSSWRNSLRENGDILLNMEKLIAVLLKKSNELFKE